MTSRNGLRWRNISTTPFGRWILHFLEPQCSSQKSFDYIAEDDEKEKLENHAQKQYSLGKSIRSTTISGLQLNNWTSSAKDHTLLLAVESIVDKKIVKGKNPPHSEEGYFMLSFQIKLQKQSPFTTQGLTPEKVEV